MTCFASSHDATCPTPTTPASAQLRPSVIFRKVTGGFRAEWGAKVYAAAASVIATGRLYRLTALAALPQQLAVRGIEEAGAAEEGCEVDASEPQVHPGDRDIGRGVS
jgi:hypothetical protein